MDSRAFTVLSLCSGGGGLDLGLRMAMPAARVVGYVEIEAYAAAVLAARMDEGLLDPAPLWSDLRTFDGHAWRRRIHCITAGYPCQPFSIAGKRQAQDDARHLWPHVARVIGEVEPHLVFLENVAHHLSLGFSEVAQELVGLRYRFAAGLFSAAEVGAPHRRQRLFVLSERLADADDGKLPVARRSTPRRAGSRPHGEDVGDADRAGRQGWLCCAECMCNQASAAIEPGDSAWPPGPDDADGWRRWLEREPGTEPAVRRSADGLAAGLVAGASRNGERIERLRLLGNGVVPLVAAHAFQTLKARLNSER